MGRSEKKFPEGIVDVIEATRSGGTVLCAGTPDKCNGMTIGWVSFGSIWGRPACTVLVRPSRHTFGFMETGDTWSVNLLGPEYKAAVDLFGTKSGRDMDKFEEAGLTVSAGKSVESVYINEASLVVECRTVFSAPMDPAAVAADYVKGCYPEGDYHKVYYGEILGIHGK